MITETSTGAMLSATAKRPRRRLTTNGFAASALLGAAPSWLLFYWLLSAGSWNPFTSGFSSSFYDVQARSLLHGTFAMPERVLLIEGFLSHGRYYMYFGPALAILHMPFVALWPQTSGHLSGVSLLVADALVLTLTARLFIRIRTLLGRCDPPQLVERVTLTLFVLAVGAGSVVLFESSAASVYLETELWAIALALWACYVGLGVVMAPTRSGVISLGALTLACVCTRLSVGVGVVCLVALLAMAHVAVWWCRRRAKVAPRWLKVAGLGIEERSPTYPGLTIASVVIPLAIVTYINWAKFGGLLAFSLPYSHQVFTSSALAGSAYATFVRRYPSLISISFVPHTLWWYFRPDAVSFSSLFPFVNFVPIQGKIGGALLGGASPTTSLTASTPVLLVGSCWGIARAIAPRSTSSEQSQAFRRMRPFLLAGLVSSVGVLTLAVVANRFMSDLMPFVVVSGALGANALVIWWTRPIPSSRARTKHLAVASLLVLLLVWSVWINTSLTYVYSRTFTSQLSLSARLSFVQTRVHLHSLMTSGPTPGVYWGGPLPEGTVLGTLYVLGDCRAVYEQSSEAPDPGAGWVGIEWSAAAGHVVLTLSKPRQDTSRALPLVVAGDVNNDLDIVALRELPNNRYEVSFLSQQWGTIFFGTKWLDSTPQIWPSSGVVHLDIVLTTPRVSGLSELRVAVGGSVILLDNIAIHSADGFVVGRLPTNLSSNSSLLSSVAPRYSGQLSRSSVYTPLCDSLVRK